MNKLLYPSLYVPALQWAGLYTEPGSLLPYCSALWERVWWEWVPLVWERYLGCPVCVPTPMESSFLRLRVDKPGYYFPWIILCSQGCHVQGKHLACTHGRVSILVLALWEKAMPWAGKLRFQRGVCTPMWPKVTCPGYTWACTLSLSLNSLPVPEPLTNHILDATGIKIPESYLTMSPHPKYFFLLWLVTSSLHLPFVLLSHFIQCKLFPLFFLFFYFSTVFVLFWDGGQQHLVFLQTRIFESLRYDLDSETIRTDSRNEWEEKWALRVKILHSANCHVIMQSCSLMFSSRQNM